MSAAAQRPQHRIIRLLTLTLVSIVFLMLLLVLGLLWATRHDNAREATLRDRHFPQLALNEALRTSVVDQQAALQGLIITGDVRFLDAFNAALDRYRETQAELLAQEPPSQRAAELLDNQFTTFDTWLVDIAEPQAASALSGELTAEQQADIIDASTATLELFQAGNEAFRDEVAIIISETSAELERLQRLIFYGALTASALLIGAALVMSLRLVRMIRAPLQQLSDVVTAVDTGDTGRRAPLLYAIEFDRLGAGINRMLDTIEHKMAESSAQASRFSTILESANDGIVVVDPAGNVTSINPAATRMLDASPEEAVGHPAHLLGVLTEPEIRNQLRSTRSTDRQPVTRRHGERVLGAVISALPSVDALEQRTGLVWVLRDVTELVRIDEMKSEFISIVSHELRTPLTAIKGFTDLILEGEAGEIGATQREFLEIVQANSDRLVALINDMLDISRIESGRIALQIEPIPFENLVDRVIATLRPLCDEKHQSIRKEMVEDLPEVMADEARLMQILTNLISNASKYTPDSGWITIGAEAHDTQIAVSVSDTGIGIGPDALPHVFSKFYRADNPLAHDVAGTGLGLSITKSLVEMHGGRITIASRVGVGTTVRFTLPSSAAGGDGPASHAPHSGVTPLVLLATAAQDEADRWEQAVTSVPASAIRARANTVPAVAAEAEIHRPAAVIVRCGDDGLPDCAEIHDEFSANPGLSGTFLMLLTDTSFSCDSSATTLVLDPNVADAQLARSVRGLLRNTATRAPRRGRVLVAEDDPDTGVWLRRVLVSGGYEVVLVHDGLAAVVRAIELLPDIVLLDVNMPRMGAIDVLPQLLTNPGTREIPIVVMSATVPDAGPHFLALGATEFFAKPLHAESLLARMAELLDGKNNGHSGRY